MESVRIGIDVGGTFTDVTLFDEKDGSFHIAKVPSRKMDPGGALTDAIKTGLEVASLDPSRVSILVHGTTIVTNALLENKLPKTSLLTTSGFKDILEIGRHFRPDMYDLQQDRQPPIVPRDRRFELLERTSSKGEILSEPQYENFRKILSDIKKDDIQAVAICFLNSFVNPSNEAKVLEWVRSDLKGLAASASHGVCPEMREFERMSTVSINAAAMPLVEKYLSEITSNIRKILPKAQILLMQSNGGSLTVDAARKFPARLLTSGPAGGALAVKRICQSGKYRNLLGVDMGGTSTDISLIRDGELQMTTEAEIANRPIKLPMIEINTIGAGAGSIAWLDEALGLHVGPQSAGSDPGPVAYGKGGTEPTVADANLVLGRLMPKYFASGRIALDLKASRLAIEKKIAKPLQMTIEEAALGIIKIANANMERAVRLSSAEKGYDPRMITMVAFGGAGPMHAAALAKSAQVPQVLIPRQPGVFSAEGLVMSDVRHDFVQTHLLSGKDLSTDKLVKIFDNLETKGAKALEEDGFSLDKQIISRTADLRYYGQAYEINVPLSNGPINESTVDDLIKKFHELHQQFYAHNHLNKIVEFVSGRLVATGLMSVPKLQEVKISKTSNKSVCFKHDTCKIYFEEENSFVETPIYFRKDLSPGTKLEGPLIVVQTDTTIVVHPDQSLSVDSYANLIISTGAIQYES